jgi:hypothetical protein
LNRNAKAFLSGSGSGIRMLAEIELQLVMQYLDPRSVLWLA